MSLINDALKRATQAPASRATPPYEPHASMQPVEYRRSALPWFFFPSVVLILAGACWFIVKGTQSSRLPGGALTVHAREPQSEPAPATPNPAEQMLAAGILPPSPDTENTPTTVPRRNFSLDDAAPASPAETTAPATSPAATVEPGRPAYRLQGIFFRTANPSATINGKNVTVGSRVGAVTVKSITREGVTLEGEGQTTVLTLE